MEYKQVKVEELNVANNDQGVTKSRKLLSFKSCSEFPKHCTVQYLPVEAGKVLPMEPAGHWNDGDGALIPHQTPPPGYLTCCA